MQPSGSRLDMDRRPLPKSYGRTELNLLPPKKLIAHQLEAARLPSDTTSNSKDSLTKHRSLPRHLIGDTYAVLSARPSGAGKAVIGLAVRSPRWIHDCARESCGFSF